LCWTRPQVQQQPADAVVDAQPAPQHAEDVVKATANDVITEMHDVSAGSDTDDAPELIADSVSRDQHDHQHPTVSHCCLVIIILVVVIIIIIIIVE